MTTITNVRVKHIRPKYNILQDWMKNPQHEYIGRGGVVFINKERVPKKASQWSNPYTVKKEGIDNCLEMFEIWLQKKIKKDGTEDLKKI